VVKFGNWVGDHDGDEIKQITLAMVGVARALT